MPDDTKEQSLPDSQTVLQRVEALERRADERLKATWWAGAAVSAAIFTVIGFMYLQFLPSLVDSKLTDIKVKVAGHDERLTSISTQITELKNFQTNFLNEILKNANAGKASVDRSLSITSATLSEAREKNVRTQPSLLRPIGGELSKVDTSTPHRHKLFAEAASEFVNYRSEMDAYFTSGFVSPSTVERRPCFVGGKSTEARTYRNCLAELDGAFISNATFESAVVHYSGSRPGAMPVLTNVTFKDCFFVAQFAPGEERLTRILVGSPEESIQVASFPLFRVSHKILDAKPIDGPDSQEQQR